MARLKQAARQSTPNDKKRKQPEEEKEKEEKKEEKEEEEERKGEKKEKEEEEEEPKVEGTGAGEEHKEEEEEEEEQGGAKRRKTSEGDEEDHASAQEESSAGSGYSLDWFRFGEIMTTGVDALTGAEEGDTTVFCDEPADEDMVRVGLTLLNSLVGEPTSVAGPWTEDVAAGRARAKEVGEGLAANDMPEFKESVEARVYRASSSSTSGQLDRFELTYLTCEDQLQYVFVLDKVERRFVFVGESGSHPHAGTNDFTYNNSDGSGPGLMLDPSAPPTPTNLLATAAQRFGEFCLNQFH